MKEEKHTETKEEIKELEKERARLEKALDLIKKRKENLHKTLSDEMHSIPVYRVADELHKKMCHMNHTDMCDYYYGDWVNKTYARTEYLEKAQKMLWVANKEICLKFIECL